MTRKFRRIAVLTAALAAITLPAFAGTVTMSVKDGAGTSHNFDMGTDASGNYFPWVALCDGTAAATCAAINASGQLAIQAPSTLPLPTGAATAANQTSVESAPGAAASSAVTVQGTTSGVPVAGNTMEFGGAAVVTGTGPGGAGIPRVTVSNDSTVGLNTGANTIGNLNNNANTTATGALTATGSVTVATNGAGAVVVSATGSGTGLVFAFQGEMPDGSWQAVQAYPVPASGQNAAVTSASANGEWRLPGVSGMTAVRVNLTAITGGTETFTLAAGQSADLAAFSTGAGAIRTDGSATVQPVSAATLPLPTGAATASSFGAAFPTTGTAIGGEYLSALPSLSSGDMATFQLDSNGRLLVSPSGLTSAQGSTTSGTTGDLVLGAAVSASPSDTAGNNYSLTLDTSGNLRMNCVTGCGVVGISQTTPGTTNAVQPIPGTSGGWTPIPESAITTAVTIKGSAGKIGDSYCYNPNSAVAYLEFFNATSVTLGTTAPIAFYEIPATTAQNLNLGMGWNFSTGIMVAAVTAYNGATTVSTGVACTFGYN